jgi:hypothetical protein
MKVTAIKDFTLAGETHAKGEVFEVDEMRGQAWIVAKVVREFKEGDAPPESPAGEGANPKTRRIIDEESGE